MIDTEVPCYYCGAKSDEGIVGHKGNKRGPTRNEYFCDVECMYDAGYGETCCSVSGWDANGWATTVYNKEKCDCAEPIGGDEE